MRLLVDSELKQIFSGVEPRRLLKDFDMNRINSISYDVIIDKFILDDKELTGEEFLLSPNEYIYVKTKESLKLRSHWCCVCTDREILMRNGIKIDTNIYYPGRKGEIIIRVCNVSKKDFVLKKNMKIAQLFFLEIDYNPSACYSYMDESLF